MYTFKLIWVNKYHPEVNLTSMAMKDNGGAHTLVELGISLTCRFHAPPCVPFDLKKWKISQGHTSHIQKHSRVKAPTSFFYGPLHLPVRPWPHHNFLLFYPLQLPLGEPILWFLNHFFFVFFLPHRLKTFPSLYDQPWKRKICR